MKPLSRTPTNADRDLQSTGFTNVPAVIVSIADWEKKRYPFKIG